MDMKSSEFPTSREPIKESEQKVLPASKLERIVGKPSGSWTTDDLIELVRDCRIKSVSLMHVGGDGWLKTLDFVPRDFSHLRDILDAGERADGSSIFAGMGIPAGASDIVLRPRASSAFLDPFTPLPTLALICGHYGRDGAPLPESPDTIVRYAYERVKSETGVDLHALGEVEYFLGKRSGEGDIYGAKDRGYHASSPFVFGEALRRRAMTVLAEIGVPVKYGHSEVGYIEAEDDGDVIWEQHEIELALQPLPLAAESVLLTQWTLRNLAHREAMRCSFDPIVREGHAGSGMHFHLSPVVDGVHLGGADAEGVLTDPAKWLIAGLAELGGALMAFGNRKRSSFIRLSQGKEAPNTVTWGRFNRKALIRLPIVACDEGGRMVSPPTVEFRLPDGSTHPHLLLAGIAQGMIAGRELKNIDKVLERTSVRKGGSSGKGAYPVPGNFAEVAADIDRHRESLSAGAVFPAHLIDSLIEALKRM